MRKFQFEKTYEEIEINDKVYKLDYADDKIKTYQDKFEKFHEEALKVSTDINGKQIDKELSQKVFDNSRAIVKDVIDCLLGEGSFETLYEESGKSLFNMVELVTYLSEIISEKTLDTREEKLGKYLKKKNKR